MLEFVCKQDLILPFLLKDIYISATHFNDRDNKKILFVVR